MKVASVSTFWTQCGVAIYNLSLCEELSKLCDLKVFAEETQEHLNGHEYNGVIDFERCWNRNIPETFDNLYLRILKWHPNLCHIQYQNAIYNDIYDPNGNFAMLVLSLQHQKIPVILTFHDIIQKHDNPSMQTWYRQIDNAITTNPAEEAELKKWNPNVYQRMIPLGSTIFKPLPKKEARSVLGLYEKPFLICQPSFYGADKGMLELLDAFSEFKKAVPESILVFAGGLHPLAPELHRSYVKEVLKRAYKLGLTNNVMFLGKFLSEDELNLWLSASDIIVLNHKSIFNCIGSSAIAHRVLCAEKPIILGDDSRLSEYKSLENCMRVANTLELTEALKIIHSDAMLGNTIAEGAVKYAHETSFAEIAKQHLEFYGDVLK